MDLTQTQQIFIPKVIIRCFDSTFGLKVHCLQSEFIEVWLEEDVLWVYENLQGCGWEVLRQLIWPMGLPLAMLYTSKHLYNPLIERMEIKLFTSKCKLIYISIFFFFWGVGGWV